MPKGANPNAGDGLVRNGGDNHANGLIKNGGGSEHAFAAQAEATQNMGGGTVMLAAGASHGTAKIGFDVRDGTDAVASSASVTVEASAATAMSTSTVA